MAVLSDLLSLLFLFVVLGWAADLAVKNVKYIGAVLKIRLFAFGILLGFITTLPELSLGVNATINQAIALSVGNLLGGIIVILGLILGASLLLSRNINTDGRLASLIPAVLVIFSPVVFGIDGEYGLFDGLAMAGLYAGLIFYLYRLNHFSNHEHVEITDRNKTTKSVIFAAIGIIGIIAASHWIVEMTLDLLDYVLVSQLVVGLIVFAIGTNLPEISIAVISWRKRSPELSLSHLLSSAFTNVLVLGVLASLRPIAFSVDSAYWITALFLGAILALFTYFYHSDKEMSWREGAILLAMYILFMATNVFV